MSTAQLSTSVPQTLWGLVEAAADRFPDRPLLTDDHDRGLDAAGLRDAALATAAAVAAYGIGPGTVVSWQLPTSLETMVVMAALARLGAVQNPVLPIWRENELRFITTQLGTEALIIPGRWRDFDHRELARTVVADATVPIIVVDHEPTPRPGALRLPRSDTAAPLGAPPCDADEARWVYYSSGTTAAPKGVRHSDRTVIAGSSGVVAMVGDDRVDRYPIAFPISHIGGAAMLAAALLTGIRLVLFDHFDPRSSPDAMARHRPTLLGTATPFFVAYLAAQRGRGGSPLFPDLRGCVGGGAPITAELGAQVRNTLGVPGIANSWGLTEFPVATSPALDAPAAVLDHTVGPPVPGVAVRVVDDHGRDGGVGANGELRLKGPQCFLGYVDAALNAEAFDADGWFRSGDMGRIDGAGNVTVTGRIKDAIIRNAENISALEIEGALAGHPGVLDVAVIGVPDNRTGERVCAVIVADAGATISLGSLAAHCEHHGLARYKAPERVEFVDSLPRNLTGKVLKTELRARFG